MARLNSKFISDIPAEQVKESANKRFVTDLHLQILENSTLPEVTINQYDDSELRSLIGDVNTDMMSIKNYVASLEGALYQAIDTILSISMKYDEKNIVAFNTCGFSFTDSLVNSNNIDTFCGCSFNGSNKSVK